MHTRAATELYIPFVVKDGDLLHQSNNRLLQSIKERPVLVEPDSRLFIHNSQQFILNDPDRLSALQAIQKKVPVPLDPRSK